MVEGNPTLSPLPRTKKTKSRLSGPEASQSELSQKPSSMLMMIMSACSAVNKNPVKVRDNPVANKAKP